MIIERIRINVELQVAGYWSNRCANCIQVNNISSFSRFKLVSTILTVNNTGYIVEVVSHRYGSI